VNDPGINIVGRDTVVGTYKVESKIGKAIIHLDGFGPSLDGKYETDQLSNKYLKMTRREDGDGSKKGAYIRREFVKQK